MASPLVIG